MDYNSSEFINGLLSLQEKVNPVLKKLGSATPTVISKNIPRSTWTKLDLSRANEKIAAFGAKDPVEFGEFIFREIHETGHKLGYGGFFEERGWYQQSAVFDDGQEPRDIHIGLDLWIEAGTAVVAPCDGVIHSFQNNAQFLDYGPTIILEHSIDNCTFYSLYGHLDEQSLEGKKVGQFIAKDSEFAAIGSPPTNGSWPPHLHFQLMLHMMDKIGDYPGVCAKSKRSLYEAVCLNPLFLLGLS